VCISHQTLNSIISKVGMKFDSKVIQWKNLLLDKLNDPGEVVVMHACRNISSKCIIGG